MMSEASGLPLKHLELLENPGNRTEFFFCIFFLKWDFLMAFLRPADVYYHIGMKFKLCKGGENPVEQVSQVIPMMQQI